MSSMPSLRRRFSSIEPRSPTSPGSPNGHDHHQIYTVPDDDDNVFSDEKDVSKDNNDGSIVPPPPTPGTAPALGLSQKKGWSKRKVRIRDVILIAVGVVLFVGLAVGTALAIILVNTRDSSSSSSSSTTTTPATTVVPSEDIQYNGHLNLSTPWETTVGELENLFIHDMEIIINSSSLYKAFVKSSLLNVSANEKLMFTLDFKKKQLEEISEAKEVTNNSLAKTVQAILREEVVKNAGIIKLPIEADTLVILADNIPTVVTTTASTTASTATTSTTTTSVTTSSSTSSTTRKTPISSTTTEAIGQCLPMTMEKCHSLLGTSHFYLPNMFHHTMAQQAMNAFMELSGPQVDTGCSESALLFLCGVLFPSCDDLPDVPVYPCDTLCEVVKNECGVLSGWPQNCDEFPKENCRGPASTTTSTTVTTTTTTTATTSTTTTVSTTESTEASSTGPPFPAYECVELDVPLCNAIGLTETVLPSPIFPCDNLGCLKDIFNYFTNGSLTSGCTSDFSFFCAFTFPGCDKANNNYPIEPCIETCTDAVHQCSKDLPFPPDCSIYVSSNQTLYPCIPPHPAPMTTTPLPDKCIDQTYSYCASEGFTRSNEMTWFADNLQDGIEQFKIWAQPTIDSGCSDLSKFFYCGIFFPKCEPGKEVGLPCRKYCEEVNAKCPSAVFPMDCSVLDDDESTCVTPLSPTTATATTSTSTTMSSTTMSPSSTPWKAHCEPLNFPLCSQFGYSLTSFPNYWGHNSSEEAIKQYYIWAEASVSSGCSPNILFYICSILFPACEGDGFTKLPCNTYCEEVNDGCPSLFNQDCATISDFNPATCLAPPNKLVCEATEFTCINLNKCVPVSALCNQENDCGDWSDERKCECNTEYQVQCAMGMCIPSYFRCDGIEQCPDNSDEFGCESDCPKNQYMCDGGNQCIQKEWVCDGQFDCSYGDDEHYCHNCEVDEFMCVNKVCIPRSQHCDGTPQCSDHSDEFVCIYAQDADSPFYLGGFGGDLLMVCAENFTDADGQTTCLKLGEISLKSWRAVPNPSYYQLYQLDPAGDSTSVIGRGKQVQDCKEVVSVECNPRECGNPGVNLRNQIIKGQDSIPGKWPWMVSLQEYGVHFCGGAIIHEYFIATASHCVDRYVDFKYKHAVAGTIDQTNLGDFGQKVEIRRAIIHPSFKWLEGNDIALVELKSPLKFNDYVKPLCLPTEDDVFTRANECYLSGWGHTKGVGGKVSQLLQETKMTLWDTEKCNSSYMWNGSLLAYEKCAGYFNGMIAACTGDSGSPVVCRDDTGKWKLAGVASYVFNTCDVPTKPMVYSDAQPYVEWMKNHTVRQFTCANGIDLFDKGMLCDTVNDCGKGDRSDETVHCDIRANCTFSDKFLCGYQSVWKLVSSGGASTENHYPLFDHTTGKYPGKYLLGLKRGDDIKTPRIDLTTPHCMRFHYHMRGNVRQGMDVSAHELDLKTWVNKWSEEGKDVGPDMWLMGTFDLEPGNYDIVFRPHDDARFAVDDIWLLEGTCAEMKCLEGEFMCETYGRRNCLPVAVRCNLVMDCDSGEDEINCAAPGYVCDFENGNICGLEQHSDDASASEWAMVNSSSTPRNLQDHTFGNASGTMLMVNTQELLMSDYVLMSQLLYMDGAEHCLKFFYASTSPATLEVEFRHDLESDSTMLSLIKFSNRTTSGWIPTQANLPVIPQGAQVILTYLVRGADLASWTLEQVIMLDDITITRGQCAPFSCPPGKILCDGEAYCIAQEKVCDRVVDCNSGSDEMSCTCEANEYKCPTGSCIPRSKTCDMVHDCQDGSDEKGICDSKRTISCDFEDVFQCGYTANTSDITFHWDRVSGMTGDKIGPFSDHTKIGDSNLVGFYMVADSQIKGTSSALISSPFVSSGNGLDFFYYAHHFIPPQIRFTGRLSFVVTHLNTGMQEELWYSLTHTENVWKRACVDLPTGNMTISFVAQRGLEFSANIAVDDIMYLDSNCDMLLTDSRIASNNNQPTTMTSSQGCDETERVCRSGMCLPAGQFCDGINDCPDGSDEFDCP